VTVTCHCTDLDWQVKSAGLLTESMPGRHTADNLAAALNEAVDAWGITGKVVECVHDNASNIVAANIPVRVDWVSVACFAHTLQLAINDAFKLFVNRVISAAGKKPFQPQHCSLQSTRGQTRADTAPRTQAHPVL
jgi:hypothetical protein